MRRLVVMAVVAGVVVAPGAAAAKGPHAILTTPREAVEPGKPWQVTVELNEFPRPPKPAMIGRRGSRTVGGEVERTPSSIDGATAYRITMIFPRRGRWALRLFADGRRFVFPAVDVGSAKLPQDYLAFAAGSRFARQGAGGPFTTDEAPAGRSATDPAGSSQRAARTTTTDDDGGGIRTWVLVLLGALLAGAALAGVNALTHRTERA
jgi:hypothetical protein